MISIDLYANNFIIWVWSQLDIIIILYAANFPNIILGTKSGGVPIHNIYIIYFNWNKTDNDRKIDWFSSGQSRVVFTYKL